MPRLNTDLPQTGSEPAVMQHTLGGAGKPRPSRRMLFGGAGAALLALATASTTAPTAAGALPPVPGDDAELIRLCRELVAQQAVMDGWNRSDDDAVWEGDGAANVAHGVWWELVEAIIPLRAVTAAGVRAKATAVPIVMNALGGSHDADKQLAASLVMDLLGHVTVEPAPSPDADLIRLCAEHDALERQYIGLAQPLMGPCGT